MGTWPNPSEFLFPQLRGGKYLPKELSCGVQSLFLQSATHNPWQKVVTEQTMVMAGADTAAAR